MKGIFLNIRRILLSGVSAVVMLLLLLGCNKTPGGLSFESHNFEKKSAVGLVIKRKYVVLYNKSTFQYVYNRNRKSIRIQSDNHSEYVHAIFKGYPKDAPQVDDIVNVEIVYKERSFALETKLILSMLVLKEENSKLWLWNEEEKVGLIVDWKMLG